MSDSAKIAGFIVVAFVVFLIGAGAIMHWLSLDSPAEPVITARAPMVEEPPRVPNPIIQPPVAPPETPKAMPPQPKGDTKSERLASEKEEAERKRKAERDADAQRQELQMREEAAAAAKVREAATRAARRAALFRNRAVPVARFQPLMAAERSATEFEKTFFEGHPDAKAVVDHFDVSTADGSLIVHLANSAADEATQNAVRASVVRAWRASQFTRRFQFSNAVEFRNGDVVAFLDTGE
jgi:hypothetical protein